MKTTHARYVYVCVIKKRNKKERATKARNESSYLELGQVAAQGNMNSHIIKEKTACGAVVCDILEKVRSPLWVLVLEVLLWGISFVRNFETIFVGSFDWQERV